eukprot:CAMPEP_0172153140 /NCGR_PEP_ID=MMETSP1050-20130122/1258_1 /TAXON_ID=233186 /ORGANISM="Cryptomonas curvata, Strain CCAP979/52" /LENGTH=93 /DNA_ID=CAMNT_0012821601 /DNA_START=278 /DNA_END=560 /DNA_ORIENTATION=-
MADLAATKKAAKGGPPPSSAGSGEMGYAGSGGLQNQIFASNNTPCGYICYGFGQFDGQGSGHDFSGNDWHPAFGFVNNGDGGRSHTYVDYRQQ